MTCDGDHRALIVGIMNAMEPRLDRTRDELEAMTWEQRLVVARWLRESLDRNRRAFDGVAWRDVRATLVALLEDILWETPNRDSPMVDGKLVALPNGQLLYHLGL